MGSKHQDTTTCSILELPFVLQHPALSQSLSISCRLLCTSKAVAAAVCTHSTGQLVHLDLFPHGLGFLQRSPCSDSAVMLGTWLRKHPQLFMHTESLTLAPAFGYDCDHHDKVAAEVLLVSELNQAGPLCHLKSFKAGLTGELVGGRSAWVVQKGLS